MRDRFINVSGELLDDRPDLTVVLADISFSQFMEAGVIERHPGRVFNVGIREQLLVGFASYSEDSLCVLRLSITSTIRRALNGRSLTSTRRFPSRGANSMNRLLTPLRSYS